jgi:tetratricopeptide (TPR) repeat protein
MPKPALRNATSAIALEDGARPAPLQQPLNDLGEAGSHDALARLNEALKGFKAVAAEPMIQRAIRHLNKDEWVEGGKWAVKALEQDEENGVAWYLVGIARERAGDFANSIKAYEAALRLLPEHAEVANDLGRLAYRMGMLEQAEKLFRHFLRHAPDRQEGINNLATAIRDQNRLDEAIEIVREALGRFPESSMLWNTLGTIMNQAVDLTNASIFFEEAARLAPTSSKPRYNLSQVKMGMGDAEGALADCDASLKLKDISVEDREMMRLARSNYLLAVGRIGEGWDQYEARLAPHFADVTQFAVDRPRWKPGMKLAGKRLLVIGEQGLGDEVLFANVLPDVADALGPDGKLHLAVERRLVPLFQRTFPDAVVTHHATYVHVTRPLRVVPDLDDSSIDCWTPIASLLREFRRTVEDFPPRERYVTPDPARVEHWRRQIEAAGPGPKVGLLWKSLITKDARHRYFSAFEQWKKVLKVPGVSFVNLQYGDCTAELEEAERELGVKIWQPPEIDLKLDLDDVTALCAAMDLVIGFSNATLNLGAAAGAPTWLITTSTAWTKLGEPDRYPWYPQARVYTAERLRAWEPVMDRVAADLADFAKER